LADDWLAYRSEGDPITKQQLLEAVPLNPDAHLEFELLAFHVFGETAITRGRLVAIATDDIRRQSFMRVYAKRDGTWRAVAVQVVPE
jgi:Domain of unknown function (DUF4440)